MYTISFLIPNPFKTVGLERIMAAFASIPYYRDLYPITHGITQQGTVLTPQGMVLTPHENTYERSEGRYNGCVTRVGGNPVSTNSCVSYQQSPTGWLAGEVRVASDVELHTVLDACIKELSRCVGSDELYDYTFPYTDRHDDVWIGELVDANVSGGGLQVPYIPVNINGILTTDIASYTCLPNPYMFPVADLMFAVWDADADAYICMPNGYKYACASKVDNKQAGFMVYSSSMYADLPHDIAPNGWIVTSADVRTTEFNMESLSRYMGGAQWHNIVDPCYATYRLKNGIVVTLPTNPEYYMVRIFPEY